MTVVPHLAVSSAPALPAPVSSRSRLPLGLALLALMGILALPVACAAQAAASAQPLVPPSAAHAITPAPADPAIVAALKQIAPERIQAIITHLVAFQTRSTISSTDTDLAPGTGVLPAADWIESQFKEISAACGNCLEVKRDDFIEPASDAPYARITKPTRIVNVYAVLRGTDPAQADRRVLVTGHYDSRVTDIMNSHGAAPGANDDASGVAVSLESARVLSKLKFPSSIVFVAVAGEEQGLNGSAHLAKLAKSEGWQLEAVLNNDIVGGDTTPGDTGQDKSAVRVFSEGVPSPAAPDQIRLIHTLGSDSDSPSRELARTITEVSGSYFPASGVHAQHRPSTGSGREPFHPVLIFRADRYLRGGDHTSFNLEGFPAVRFTEWRENFDHQHQDLRVENGIQYGDLIQFVDFHYVANVARLNAAVLAELAAAPGPPQEVHILTQALDNNTELKWDPPAGAPANTTYEVVWRPTEQPNWTEVLSTGSNTTVRIALSKDNVVFGVRAVDSAGHRSVAILPLPQRRTAPPAPKK
jgi:Peptidase family M28